MLLLAKTVDILQLQICPMITCALYLRFFNKKIKMVRLLYKSPLVAAAKQM